MDRKEYTTDRDGLISNPGKFEAEPIYVPYFWEQGLDGGADDDTHGVWFFNITDEDRKLFPEIPADCVVIGLTESDTGFVGHRCFTAEEYARHQQYLETLPDEGEE